MFGTVAVEALALEAGGDAFDAFDAFDAAALALALAEGAAEGVAGDEPTGGGRGRS